TKCQVIMKSLFYLTMLSCLNGLRIKNILFSLHKCVEISISIFLKSSSFSAAFFTLLFYLQNSSPVIL
ncbi:MAG TPA: hypothetical protein PKH20_08115, partial [Exilispira sp.]|nr:hypothetical protein [Exilispira sp.]